MGVSGTGKSTIGIELSQKLGIPFLEGDNLHSVANKNKMRERRENQHTNSQRDPRKSGLNERYKCIDSL